MFTTPTLPATVRLEAVRLESRRFAGSVEWIVTPVWAGVDRPTTGGWVFQDKTLAERLVRAIEAGAAHQELSFATDVNGDTYVAAKWRVLGKYANADLKRIGF